MMKIDENVMATLTADELREEFHNYLVVETDLLSDTIDNILKLVDKLGGYNADNLATVQDMIERDIDDNEPEFNALCYLCYNELDAYETLVNDDYWILSAEDYYDLGYEFYKEADQQVDENLESYIDFEAYGEALDAGWNGCFYENGYICID